METGATTGAGRRWVMPEGMTGRPACIRPGGGWHAASSHGNGRKPRGPVRCTKAARACCPEGADVNPDWLVRLFCSGLSGCPAPVSGMRVSGRRAPQGQPLTASAGPGGAFTVRCWPERRAWAASALPGRQPVPSTGRGPLREASRGASSGGAQVSPSQALWRLSAYLRSSGFDGFSADDAASGSLLSAGRGKPAGKVLKTLRACCCICSCIWKNRFLLCSM